MPTTKRATARLFSGPPLTLPRALDRLAERWAAAPPRVRVAIGVVAVVALLAVAGRGAARSPWGPPVPVVLAAADLGPGEVVAAGDLRTTEWPRGLVPPASLDAAQDAVGRVLAVGAPTGTPLTTRHIAPAGLAAGLDDGRVAMPVQSPTGTEFVPGQHVDVLAGAQWRGRVVARGATVLALGDGVVWLAVARADAPRVATAAATGALTVVLLPGPH